LKISIIIATYNSSKTLSQCLESIIVQKTSAIEIIVVDGKSNDETLKIVKGFGASIDHVISGKDEGIYDAWNKGIMASSGEWIMYLGSDDVLCNGILDKMLSFIGSNTDVEYISGKVMLVDEGLNKIRIIGKPYNWSSFKTYMNVAHVASLHNKILYEKFGYYDLNFKICGDYEFLLRVNSNLKTQYLNEVFAKMRVGGVSSGSFDSLIEARAAKLKNNIKSIALIYLDYFYAVIKLKIKNMIAYI
jgi:glycosyltransferase involved in cell wall biosynthesis